MDIQRLVTMANQIGDFYESYPNQSHAQQDIAGHLNKFWALPMRKQIAEYVRQDGAGLHAQVVSAIKLHLQV
ncbi:MAG TPA: formate dehydrogenase subunit delta [Methylotenera sp.]|nr:formate dehydrogenase subunit delta [Methylotenera sp.]HPH05933.1 formate dehydrogenase subunit delta [Methylotenera sp.]HPN00714.1 formate dehydrogenase subunit delta [Methylotenera sp.]